MTVQFLIEHHLKFLDKSSKGGNRTFVCAHCGNKYNGSQTRQLAHLLGPKGKGIAVCTKIHEGARQELLAAVNRVNGNAAGQASTCVALKETVNDGDQSRKRFRQQELPCILKASSPPPSSNAQGGDVRSSPASPASQMLCRPDTQQASQICTGHIATQDATTQQPTPEAPQHQPICDSMEERDTGGQEAWALPASAMEPAASPQRCTPAEQDVLNGQPQPRTAGSLPSSTAPSGQQARGIAGHNSRDPRLQSPAERPPSSAAAAAAAAASTPPALRPSGTSGLTRSQRDNTSMTAAGRNALGREAQPCRVFDCSAAAAAAVSAGLTRPVSPLALGWRSSPDQHCPGSNQPEEQCEGGLVEHLSVRDTDLIVLQAQVSRLESANQELAQRLSDQTAAREEGRLRIAELSAELRVKDEHIKALLQVIKEGLIGQQR